jgi:hypothetical protein
VVGADSNTLILIAFTLRSLVVPAPEFGLLLVLIPTSCLFLIGAVNAVLKEVVINKGVFNPIDYNLLRKVCRKMIIH